MTKFNVKSVTHAENVQKLKKVTESVPRRQLKFLRDYTPAVPVLGRVRITELGDLHGGTLLCLGADAVCF